MRDILHWPRILRRCGRPLLLLGLLLLCGRLAPGQAQVPTAITPDDTMGTAVTRNGTAYRIEGGRRRGANLFHSFDRFSVGTNDTASFAGSRGIDNILSRVTGGQQSVIDGLLRSEIPGANLFLFNPAGVLFGPNASLEVNGSFHVSTADYLRFADGATFAVDSPAASVLSMAAPQAFGFLHANPAAITLQGGSLRVSTGKTLSIISGGIAIAGGPDTSAERPSLGAPHGRIYLASVASPGEVMTPTAEQTPAFPGDSFAALGVIDITENAQLTASADPGGSVIIRGGQVLVDSSFIETNTLGDRDGSQIGIDIEADTLRLTRGTLLNSSTFGAGAGGEVRVMVSDTFVVAGTFDPNFNPLSAIFSDTLGSGEGGGITLSAPTVRLDDRGFVSAGSFGAGHGGDIVVQAERFILTGVAQVNARVSDIGAGGTITVTATESITMTGRETIFPTPIGIISGTVPGSRGAGGDIVVSAPIITLTEGAFITSATDGVGRGGNVTVTATQTLTLVGADRLRNAQTGIFADSLDDAVGDAGHVMIAAPMVRVQGGARITSVTAGPGHGGTVTVRAAEALLLTGTSPSQDASRFSPSAISTNAFGTGVGAGDAGTIVVEAPSVSVREGAQISSRTIGPGKGGTVLVTATDTIAISGLESGLFSDTTGSNIGGTIVLHARHVELTENAQITAASRGTADAQAGAIRITATDTFLSDHSAVMTTAERAQGGTIVVMADALVRLRHSTITTSVAGGDEQAGNITLDAGVVVLEESQVRANAERGPGGNIRITADAVLADAQSTIDASSRLGIDGTVDIQAVVANLSETVLPLPQTFTQAATLLRDPCVAQLQEGRLSSLVMQERASVPTTYDDLLPSRLYVRSPQPTAPTAASHQEERQGGAAGQRPAMSWARPTVPLALSLECAR